MGLAKRYQEEREALGWFPVDDKYVCPECLSDHVLVQAATEGAEADSCSYCHQRTPGKPLAAPVDLVLELIAAGLYSEYEDPIHGAGWDGGWTVPTSDTYDLLWDHDV